MPTVSIAGAAPRPPLPELPLSADGKAAGSVAAGKAPAGRKPNAPSGPASPHASPVNRGRTSHVAKSTAKVTAGAPAAASASKPAAAAKPAAATRTTTGYATAASSGDWAFLSEKGLSIEEKLARFAAVAMARIDKDLEAKMAEYKAQFGGSSSSSSAKKSGGLSLFGMLESAVPGLSELSKVFGESAFKKAASSLGGPVLAAAATALGMPELAPLALKYGGQLTALAFTEVGGTSSATSSGSSSSSSSGPSDEKVAMLELQILVEKQQRLFTAISDTLKACHDTQMAAVRNLC